MENTQTEKKKPKRKWLLLLLLLLLLIGVGGVLFFVFGPGRVPVNPASSPSGPTLDNIGSAKNGTGSAGSLSTKKSVKITDMLIKTMTFPSGNAGAKGNWILENPSSNNVIVQALVYIGGKWVDEQVKTSDGKVKTQKVYAGKNITQIAESVPIWPNQYIDHIALQRDVIPGNYDAMAVCYYFTTDKKEFTQKFGYPVRVTVS